MRDTLLVNVILIIGEEKPLPYGHGNMEIEGNSGLSALLYATL